VARALKAAVRDATGLSCSVGVTPNKLLSKICSDLDKPDGLTLLAQDEIPARIWPLPAKKINGIGPKATEKLAGFGIHTIGDLAAADPAFLLAQFGKYDQMTFADYLRGQGASPAAIKILNLGLPVGLGESVTSSWIFAMLTARPTRYSSVTERGTSRLT